MKLLINVNIAIVEVKIINITLNKPTPPDSNDFGSRIPTIAIKNKKVNRTARCATILFSFSTPLLHKNNISLKLDGYS